MSVRSCPCIGISFLSSFRIGSSITPSFYVRIPCRRTSDNCKLSLSFLPPFARDEYFSRANNAYTVVSWGGSCEILARPFFRAANCGVKNGCFEGFVRPLRNKPYLLAFSFLSKGISFPLLASEHILDGLDQFAHSIGLGEHGIDANGLLSKICRYPR